VTARAHRHDEVVVRANSMAVATSAVLAQGTVIAEPLSIMALNTERAST
jgi:hypothetical protein